MSLADRMVAAPADGPLMATGDQILRVLGVVDPSPEQLCQALDEFGGPEIWREILAAEGRLRYITAARPPHQESPTRS